jgi:hypothetical protein
MNHLIILKTVELVLLAARPNREESIFFTFYFRYTTNLHPSMTIHANLGNIFDEASNDLDVAFSEDEMAPAPPVAGRLRGQSVPYGESFLPTTGGNEKLYAVVVLPVDLTRCDTLVRGNESFCVRTACKSNHLGDGATVKIGHETLVVVKHKASAFVEPRLELRKVTEELRTELLAPDSKRTFTDWNNLFMNIETAYEDQGEPVSMGHVQKGESELKRALQFVKTPGKKRLKLESINDDDSSDGLFVFQDVAGFQKVSFKEEGEDDISIAARVEKLEVFLHNKAEIDKILWNKTGSELTELNGATSFQNTTLTSVLRTIGDFGTSFPSTFERGSLFDTIGCVGKYATDTSNKVAKLGKQVDLLSFNEIASKVKGEVERHFVSNVSFKDFSEKLSSFIKKNSRAHQSTNAKISSLQSLIDNGSASYGASETEGLFDDDLFNEPMVSEFRPVYDGRRPHKARGVSQEVYDQKVVELTATIESLSEAVNSMRLGEVAQSPKSEVKFGALHFRNMDDASSFVSAKPGTKHFGLYVDIYTVCGHVLFDMQGRTGYLSNLESIKKLNIGTVREALSMTAFVNPIPDLFHESGKGLVGINDSRFSKFKTWEEWKNRGKDVIPTKLVGVEYQLTQHVDTYITDPSLNALYKLSITTSCAALTSFVNWLTKNTEELIQNDMKADKAWRLSTRLGDKVFREIFTVRAGVADGFEVTEGSDAKRAIQSSIWLHVSRTLDKTAEFARVNFSDHECISSEYVRFLVNNNDSSDVSSCLSSLKEVKEELKRFKAEISKASSDATKEAKAANNACSTANNKFKEAEKRYATKKELEGYKKN